MRTLKYGGQLSPGDFIAVAYSNHIDLGWYFGNGINQTLQYYSFRYPKAAYEKYQSFKEKVDKGILPHIYESKRYSNGFTIKCIYKSYINAVHATRVMKITNPEEIFQILEDKEDYKKSKEALISLNFIKK